MSVKDRTRTCEDVGHPPSLLTAVRWVQRTGATGGLSARACIGSELPVTPLKRNHFFGSV